MVVSLHRRQKRRGSNNFISGWKLFFIGVMCVCVCFDDQFWETVYI